MDSKNLVKNGSFENHSGPESVQLTTSESFDSQWVILDGVGDVFSMKGTVYPHGKKAVQLSGTISQKVKGFIPGKKYILTYQINSYATPNNPIITPSIVATIAGERDYKQFKITNKGIPGGYAMPGHRQAPWHQRTVYFTALADEHELTFTCPKGNTERCLLDNVSIVPQGGD